uniref:Uncharacterized protein n=2 Tax=Bombyx mori TaxID=7091 RepID=A0A8R2AN38_BOMMO|nr:uncharacterized protein LOC101745969 [Bombyx mori]
MFKYLFFLAFVTSAFCTDVDYFDDVVNMLMNYDDRLVASAEEDEGEQPVLSEGIWKCGDCEQIQESNLIYNEVNEVISDLNSDESVQVQVSYSLQDMRCITVSADEAKSIRRVSGSCSGDSVTLSVTPTRSYQFTVKLYS